MSDRSMTTASPPRTDPKRSFAIDVVRRLSEAGYQGLWAGGCVRDQLLGLPPSDFDIATNARPEQVMQLFRRTVPVGASFGVVKVLGPRNAGEVEVATFRSDGAYIDGRRPESVVFSSPKEDASRRDFTINGMFYDPLNDLVIDYVGGEQDLKIGTIRAIGDPKARFEEDKLRLIRAVRFAARFGFKIEPKTKEGLDAMATQISVVAVERIAQELEKMLVHPSRATGVRLLIETGLLNTILPEATQSGGGVVRVLGALAEQVSFPLGLAVLLHRVGSTTIHDNAAEAGIIVERVAHRLKLSNADRDRARWLVEHQDALNQPDQLPIARLKRLIAMPGIDELLELHRALAVANGAGIDHIAFCQEYLQNQPDGPIAPEPLLNGNDLKRLGLRPGPQFKTWLDRAYDAQLEGEFGETDDAIHWIQQQLKQSAQK